MATLCSECGHYPSERFEACLPDRCCCKCHDVADAAPDLLAASKKVAEWLRSKMMYYSDLRRDYAAGEFLDQARVIESAVFKAEGES